MKKWIPVIINPTSDQRSAVLARLNHVFLEAGVRWSVEITQGEADAMYIARRLAEQGAEMVAVMGGDGTISEVAWGLAGTPTALAILPGGTGNVLAYEFGIPHDLTRAARLLVSPHTLRRVDVGEVGGPNSPVTGETNGIPSRKFLLRAGAGLEALAIQHAPRSLKDRFGLFAYGLAGFQALLQSRPVHYTLNLDGQVTEVEGVLCSVANAGHLGITSGLSLTPTVDIADGLLDIIVMTRLDLENIVALLTNKIAEPNGLNTLFHWQVRQASILSDPPQDTQVDGDQLGTTPMLVRAVPQALQVVVPLA